MGGGCFVCASAPLRRPGGNATDSTCFPSLHVTERRARTSVPFAPVEIVLRPKAKRSYVRIRRQGAGWKSIVGRKGRRPSSSGEDRVFPFGGESVRGMCRAVIFGTWRTLL